MNIITIFLALSCITNVSNSAMMTTFDNGRLTTKETYIEKSSFENDNIHSKIINKKEASAEIVSVDMMATKFVVYVDGVGSVTSDSVCGYAVTRFDGLESGKEYNYYIMSFDKGGNVLHIESDKFTF